MTCRLKSIVLYDVVCEVINITFIYYIVVEIFLIRAGLRTKALSGFTGFIIECTINVTS
jgi:hypothetical protein